jgi:hypothetical protein
MIKLTKAQKQILNAMANGEILYLANQHALKREFWIKRQKICREVSIFALLRHDLICDVQPFRYRITEKGQKALLENIDE